MYSEKREYLSLMVGGAITNLANAEQEYEECLLKAKAIFELGEK
jgi:para-aminobenzoate synthetase component 1